MKITYANVMQCDNCNNSGIIMAKNLGGIWGKRCECHNKRKSLLELHKSGLYENIKNMRFDNYSHQRDYQQYLFDTCQRFIAQNKFKFLFIGGQTGSGKTHMGTAACEHFLSQGQSTIYTTFKMLMNDVKSKVNDQEYAEVIRKYGDIRVLYIDDFMKSEPSKADIDHSFELINMRVAKKKITIITSERMLEEIIEIDEALGGRIKQMCGQFAVGIARKAGRNWRLQEHAKGA